MREGNGGKSTYDQLIELIPFLVGQSIAAMPEFAQPFVQFLEMFEHAATPLHPLAKPFGDLDTDRVRQYAKLDQAVWLNQFRNPVQIAISGRLRSGPLAQTLVRLQMKVGWVGLAGRRQDIEPRSTLFPRDHRPPFHRLLATRTKMQTLLTGQVTEPMDP